MVTANITLPSVRWVRITKERAQERWAAGDSITLCPCNLHPSNPWGTACTISPSCYMGRARANGPGSPLWAGSVELTAFNLMVDEWSFHNSSFTAGRYAHFYIAKPIKKQVEDVICAGRV